VWLAHEHRSRRQRERSTGAGSEAQASGRLASKAEGRTAKM
jgi:hypothetical protein